MTAPNEPTVEMVNVQIDGVWQQVPKGTNAIEAARAYGKLIPHYCYHPKLEVVGNCRMCLFEMGMPKMGPDRKPVMGEDGKPEISWIPRPQIACATKVSEGMGIKTDSPLTEDCRKGVMEFLLINHPLDCPICDQAGECKLQEFSMEYGNAESRFLENKVKKPKRVDLGERIVLDDERCILCTRCVRFMRDVAKDDCLGIVSRGGYSYLTAHPDRRLDSKYSLNTVDICPVGALTSKEFRFKMRVWFLQETRSIDVMDGTGANIVIGAREGRVYRITPRENNAVNECWLHDDSRTWFQQYQSKERLMRPLVRIKGEEFPTDWTDAFTQLGRILATNEITNDQVAIVASASMTCEELFLVKRLQSLLGGNRVAIDIVPRPQTPDGLLLSGDGNANSNGARLIGVSQGGTRLPLIAQGINSGKYRVVFAFHEDLTAVGVKPEALSKLHALVAVGCLPHATTQAATLLLPGAAYYEKRGSLINVKGRIQRLNRAVLPPGAARDDWEILDGILRTFGDTGVSAIEGIFKAMAEAHPTLAGLSLSKIGDLGVDLTQAATPLEPIKI